MLNLLISLLLPAFVAFLYVSYKYNLYVHKRLVSHNHCPVCSQNYGTRVKTPFLMSKFREMKGIQVKSYKCLSCKSVFFVKEDLKAEETYTQKG
ncbi:MAG: hypothetical protein ACOVQ4_13295 [Flectobacillus sp.]|uniref:hypothetical protein n=1 Tax=Flectobacillus sp. TaxID=50419 RepID=UPI003B9C76CE